MTYRIYFNRGDSEHWPQVWSIDEGDQSSEWNVLGYVLHGVTATSKTLPAAAQGRTDGKVSPFAWLEVHGRIEMRAGWAHVYQV